MSCTIATLAACLSLSGIYVDASVMQSDANEVHIETIQAQTKGRIGINVPPYVMPIIVTYDKDIAVRDAGNTLGRVVIGFDIALPKLSIFIEAGHKSDPFTRGDDGENFAALGIRARPFAR